MAQPVTEYHVIAEHKTVDLYDKLPDAKDAAFDYTSRTNIRSTVEKRVVQSMFTYTPQNRPPPVES